MPERTYKLTILAQQEAITHTLVLYNVISTTLSKVSFRTR